MNRFENVNALEQLKGHVDFDTAYVIEDYPYGRCRTQMKVWIETKQTGVLTKGNQRVVWCSLNPKTGRWNKPKPNTYHRVVSMYLDDIGHVQSAGMSGNAGFNSIEAYLKIFEIPESQKALLYVCLNGAYYSARNWGDQTEEEAGVRVKTAEALIRYYVEIIPKSHEVIKAERDEALYMDDLKGTKLKKALGKDKALSVRKRYHNKNNSGGNFAVDIRIQDDPEADPNSYTKKRWVELSGVHDTTGKIRRLEAGRMWKHSQHVDLETVNSFDKLVMFILIVIDQYAELP